MNIKYLPSGIYLLNIVYELLAFLYLLLPDIIKLNSSSSLQIFYEDIILLTLTIINWILWILTIFLSVLMCQDIYKRRRQKLMLYVWLHLVLFTIHGIVNGFKVEREEIMHISFSAFQYFYLWIFEFVILGVLRLLEDLENVDLHLINDQGQGASLSRIRLFGMPLKRHLQLQFFLSWLASPYMAYAIWVHWNLPELKSRFSHDDAIAVMVLLFLTSLPYGPNSLILYKALKKKSLHLTLNFFWTKAGIWFIVGAFYYAFIRIRNEALNSPFPAWSHVNELFVSLFNTLEHVELLYYMKYLRRKKRQRQFMLNKHNLNDYKLMTTIITRTYKPLNVQDFDADVQRLLKNVEISKYCVKIGNKKLGEGNFGEVWQGFLTTRFFNGSEIPVAVKLLKSGGDKDALNSMISELKTLSWVKEHPNLVSFYGAFWNNDDFGNPIGIVMNYCTLGSLEKYLKEIKKHEDFPRNVDQDELKKLNEWSMQIANAMEYLGQQKVIHGDLATRNVLLDSNEMAKVSDFGMSLRLYHYQLYARSKHSALPWRWLAPEVLIDLKFSTKSDVWAFGVTLWEIYTYADFPWGAYEWSSDFVDKLKDGLLLEKPRFASDRIYQEIICRCWDLQETSRISFQEVIQILESFNIER